MRHTAQHSAKGWIQGGWGTQYYIEKKARVSRLIRRKWVKIVENHTLSGSTPDSAKHLAQYDLNTKGRS